MEDAACAGANAALLGLEDLLEVLIIDLVRAQRQLLENLLFTHLGQDLGESFLLLGRDLVALGLVLHALTVRTEGVADSGTAPAGDLDRFSA